MLDPTIHGPSDDPGVPWLDNRHVLEPVQPGELESHLGDTPVVKDARGRLWRVRRVTPWSSVALLVACAVLLALIWLAASQY